ncbi:MAG: serine/threonine-protein kinase [Nostocaceae cyanobacterium]|nr:serine/threonine-protein kinase [Nostocaceae cyanobacterium]
MSQSTLLKPEIPSGTIIDNRYIIQKLLGQGGLGRTYLAFDTRRFNEPCVLKEFAPIGSGKNELDRCRSLFKREAKILHQLQHPQIPSFLACFEGEGRLFLVQQFVDGKTYSQILRERQTQGQTFSEEEVIDWLKNLLAILEYVHQHHIIHRDISPDNIMLPEGQMLPVLIDFGVGKQIAELQEANNSTQPTFVGKMSLVGKVGYAPREQISLGLCSPSSDLYSLGVTAVVLLTGRDPSFLMDQYTLEWKWRFYTDVSDTFGQILDKMLADTPCKRYQTAREVITVLEFFGSVQPTIYQTQQPVQQYPPSTIAEIPTSTFAPQSAEVPPTVFTPQSQQQATVAPSNNQLRETIFSNSSTEETNLNQQVTSINDAFIQRCEEQLAYYIGPMANFIVEDTLAENPQVSPYQFVEILAREIPDVQAAIDFTRKLLS